MNKLSSAYINWFLIVIASVFTIAMIVSKAVNL